MKQFVFCMVFTVFVGTSSLAQDKHQDNLVSSEFQFSQPNSAPLFEFKDKTAVVFDSRWNRIAKRIRPVENRFIVFTDESSFTQKANPQEEKVATDQSSTDSESFQWSAAIKQSMMFLGVQHGYALTQPKTQRDLKGPFFRDYVTSVKSLHGWGDGGKFFTNYIAHPMQGSLFGFIQVQNDPKGRGLRFNESGTYWRSRLKALAWSAAWSTQFEIGPVSQASIGNVGLHGKQTYVDIVMTPTAGIGLLVLEDFLDQKLIRRIERNSRNYFVRVASRTLLNPTRSVANLLRFKTPWYRDQALRFEVETLTSPSNHRTRSN